MSGGIDLSELKAAIAPELKDIDESTWTEIIEEVDSNNDGIVDLEEFFRMMYDLPCGKKK